MHEGPRSRTCVVCSSGLVCWRCSPFHADRLFAADVTSRARVGPGPGRKTHRNLTSPPANFSVIPHDRAGAPGARRPEPSLYTPATWQWPGPHTAAMYIPPAGRLRSPPSGKEIDPKLAQNTAVHAEWSGPRSTTPPPTMGPPRAVPAALGAALVGWAFLEPPRSVGDMLEDQPTRILKEDYYRANGVPVV